MELVYMYNVDLMIMFITCRLLHIAWSNDYGQSVETIPYKSEFVLYMLHYNYDLSPLSLPPLSPLSLSPSEPLSSGMRKECKYICTRKLLRYIVLSFSLLLPSVLEFRTRQMEVDLKQVTISLKIGHDIVGEVTLINIS